MFKNKTPGKRMKILVFFIAVMALGAAVLAAPTGTRSILLNSPASFPLDI
ncbi:MAG: hypothetical protein Q9M22_03305 [Mariprofundaceae bacterium]|nr:hypothetical protein [Mariprofundaceae bacterium]